MNYKVLAFSILFFVAACADPTGMCGCPPLMEPYGVLMGTVTTPEGAPVAGASIAAELASPDCVSLIRTLTANDSRPNGTFSLEVYRPLNSRVGECLRAIARPPAGSALRESEAKPFAIALDGFGADTVRLDFVLRSP